MSDETRFDGIVIWFKGGIGFIAWERNGVKQRDIFLHYSDIACEGYKTVNKNQKVSFAIGLNKHGQDKAIDIVIK